jgi:hypothetical protein
MRINVYSQSCPAYLTCQQTYKAAFGTPFTVDKQLSETPVLLQQSASQNKDSGTALSKVAQLVRVFIEAV